MRPLSHRHVTLRQRTQRMQRLRMRRPQPSLSGLTRGPGTVEEPERGEEGREESDGGHGR